MALTVQLCDAGQPSPELKVVGLDLVGILAEFCPDMLSPHQAGLLQVGSTLRAGWPGCCCFRGIPAGGMVLLFGLGWDARG